MLEEQYWQIMEDARECSIHHLSLCIENKLHQLSPEEIIAFELTKNSLINKACSIDLFCAYYIIQGRHRNFHTIENRDKNFADFIFRIMLYGKQFYYATMKEPDKISSISLEEMNNLFHFTLSNDIPYNAYKKKTNWPMRMFIIECDSLKNTALNKCHTNDFLWVYNYPDTVKAKCPKLFDLYWHFDGNNFYYK